jgi:hypothetical protein
MKLLGEKLSHSRHKETAMFTLGGNESFLPVGPAMGLLAAIRAGCRCCARRTAVAQGTTAVFTVAKAATLSCKLLCHTPMVMEMHGEESEFTLIL